MAQRSLETYDQVMDLGTMLILETGSEFLKYLERPR